MGGEDVDEACADDACAGDGAERQATAPPACLVVGMQDAAAYHRDLLPLSLGHLAASVVEQASATGAVARGTPLSATRASRWTFPRSGAGEDEGGSARAPLWWSPLLDNVVPPEARWTMSGKDGSRGAVECWGAHEASGASLPVPAPFAPLPPYFFQGVASVTEPSLG